MDFPSALSAPYWILAATWASSTHLRALSPQARACFEQGALPSLLYLPGIVPVVTLPGDTMFQSTIIQEHTQRPVILHAYAGAKVHMETMLQLLKHHGWISMAAAMIGTQKKPPAWTTEDLRAVTGLIRCATASYTAFPKRGFVAPCQMASSLSPSQAVSVSHLASSS